MRIIGIAPARFAELIGFDPRTARNRDDALFPADPPGRTRYGLRPRSAQQLAALADQLFSESFADVQKRIRSRDWEHDPALPVAIHDGAHVYVCHSLGIMIYSARITNDSGSVFARFDDPRVTDADRLRVDLAGGAATCIAENRPIIGRLVVKGMDRDLESIGRIVDRHYGRHVADPQGTEFFQAALADTIRIVKDGWATVTALARALVIERKLGPSQIDEILGAK
jgi:hypothetical protein